MSKEFVCNELLKNFCGAPGLKVELHESTPLEGMFPWYFFPASPLEGSGLRGITVPMLLIHGHEVACHCQMCCLVTQNRAQGFLRPHRKTPSLKSQQELKSIAAVPVGRGRESETRNGGRVATSHGCDRST